MTVWRDAAPIQARVADAQRDVVIVLVAAGVRARGDAVPALPGVARATGTPARRAHRGTSGAIPSPGCSTTGPRWRCWRPPRRPHASGGGIGVALVDIDNFRLFNEVHGHEAADEVLLRVAALVDEVRGPRPSSRATGRTSSCSSSRAPRSTPSACPRRDCAPAWRLWASDSATPRSSRSRSASGSPPTRPMPGRSPTSSAPPRSRIAEARAGGGDAVRGPHADPEAEEGACPPGLWALHRPGHRGRYEGPLHQAPLRGRRPLRRRSWPADSAWTTSCGARSTSPGCSTTSARSASPTPSCASPRS